MIQYRVANLYTSVNKAGYMYQDGNCNNVLGVIQQIQAATRYAPPQLARS